MITNYEKDLNELKEQILEDGDTLVSKRDLLERFCEIDEEYNGEPWNLLQILSNMNVLIGEEPCDELDFVQPHKKVSVNLEPCEDAVNRDAIKLKIAEMPKYTEGKKLASIRHLKDFLEKELEESIEVTQDMCIGFTMALENIRWFITELPSVVPKGVTVTDFADKCRECGKLREKYKKN